MKHITGHHHLSMITKDIQENVYFYETILGLRLVKKTVNQDEPTMYHIFYGDRTGAPGTELTFFEMPKVGQTYRGSNAITRISLIVPSEESLHFWRERLTSYGVKSSDITTYANRSAVHFEDPDGLRLVFLVEEEDTLAGWEAWEHSTVPEDYQIRGFGPVEITVRRPEKMLRTLVEIFKYNIISETENKFFLQSSKGNTFSEIVIKYLDEPTERPGRGSIHHLAIRVAADEDLEHWDYQIKQRGFVSTGIIDRYYFKSIYFRESNGILFEVSTDGPGFTIDSSVESLGKQLDLPPAFEGQREEIEAQLQPIGGKRHA